MGNSMKADVTRGIKWLDKHYPGWDRLIDLARLNMGSMDHCICGQLGIQDTYVVRFGGEFPYTELMHFRQSFGFHARFSGATAVELRDEWRERILIRRGL